MDIMGATFSGSESERPQSAKLFRSSQRDVYEVAPNGKHQPAHAGGRLRTFPVTPSYRRGDNFIQFNVESVSEMDVDSSSLNVTHGHKHPFFARHRDFNSGNWDSEAEDDDESNANDVYQAHQYLSTKVEVTSPPPVGTVGLWGSGLYDTALGAFRQHQPLALRPDDIWSTLTYSFAKHVQDNAEKLRHKFVQHEGKKQLKIETVPSFTMGEEAPEAWEEQIFPLFSQQIRAHIGDDTHAAIVGGFSTTTPTDVAANEITLMSAMKQYFSFAMNTMCGVPWIRLEGSREDWARLRAKAETLGSLMVPKIGKDWMACLLPVLDQFCLAWEGEQCIDYCFWQNMVKVRQHGMGSGSYETISGWIQCFYLDLCPFKSWKKLAADIGPRPEDFPSTQSSVPVEWEYHGQKTMLRFHAGCVGTARDQATGALRPVTLWGVTHDKPSTKEGVLDYYKKLKAKVEAAGEGSSHVPLRQQKNSPQRRLSQLRSLIVSWGFEEEGSGDLSPSSGGGDLKKK